MADIVDILRLEIDDALRDIGRVEQALDRALAPVEVDIEVDERALAELENTLHEVQRIADRAATETQSIALAAGRAEANFEDLARAMGITEAEARDLTAELLDAQAASNRLEDSARDVARQLGLSENEADRLTTSLRQADRAAESIDVSTVGLAARFGAIRTAAAGVAGAFAAIGGAAIFGAAIVGANAAVQSFARLEDSINAVNVIFGVGAQEVLEFGETAARSAGLSQQAFNQAVTPIGSLLQNFGFDAREAADAAVILVQRSADLASVLGGSVQDALLAVGAALRGEADPLERYGASISAARVEQFALASELARTKAEITPAITLQARYGLILEDTAKVAGDYVNTAEDLANAQRTAGAEVQNFVDDLGKDLAPALETIIVLLPELLDGLQQLAPGFIAASDSAAAFFESVGEGGGFRTEFSLIAAGFDVVTAGAGIATEAGNVFQQALTGNMAGAVAAVRRGGALIERSFVRGIAVNFANALDKGIDSVTAFNTALRQVASGTGSLDVFTESYQAFSIAADLSDEELRSATIAMIENADAMKLTAPEVQFLNEQLTQLNGLLAVDTRRRGPFEGLEDIPFESFTTRFTTFTSELDEIPERLQSVASATRLAAGLIGEALDPFDDATAIIEVSAQEFFNNLTNQINEQAEFQAGLARLVAAGFGDLAEEIGKQGPGAQKAVDQFLNNLDLAERAERLLDGEGTEVARQIGEELVQELAGSNLSPQIQQAFIALIEDGIFSNSQVENAIVTGTASAASTTISSFREALIEEAATFDASFLADSVGAALGASLDFSDLAAAQARKTVNAYERTFRDEFEISSPSKLMMRIGEQVAEGFLIGAQQNDLALKVPAASITGRIADGTVTTAPGGGFTFAPTYVNTQTKDLETVVARSEQLFGSVSGILNGNFKL